MEFKAIVTGTGTIAPLTDNDFRLWLKLKEGDFLNIETWKARNIDFHRKFFSLLNTTINLLPEDERFDKLRNIDYLRRELMVLIGEVDMHITFDGDQILIPRSISFKNMDDEKFAEIYNLSVVKIVKTYLKHISYEDFTERILDYY